MGRIKKVANSKHDTTLSPAISAFITTTQSEPLHKIPALLDTFPRRWPFPRGDLYHWIPVLNRFDRIIELFSEEYGLSSGPQTQPIGRRLLLKGDAGDGTAIAETAPSAQELDQSGYPDDGDRELIERILSFTRLLLENCGNRSLYASSDQLGKLLNTTSTSLLKTTLRLTLRLAQRYHTSRSRVGGSSAMQTTLLSNHYNINIDHVQKIAASFARGLTSTAGSGKGKDKLPLRSDAEEVLQKTDGADLVGKIKVEELPAPVREEFGSVHLTYYDTAPSEKEDTKSISSDVPTGPPAPTTPTPIRRTSNLGPNQTPRLNRVSSSDGSPQQTVPSSAARQNDSLRSAGPKYVELSHKQIASRPAYELVRDSMSGIPEDIRYDLLHRVRVAQALSSDRKAREDIVAVRLLAIANLAYVQSDSTFYQKFGQQDAEEPRRLQLMYQLSELIHPPGTNELGASKELQTIALCTLEALTKQKSKFNDFRPALSLNVNHGVLFYVARKAVAEIAVDDGPGGSFEDDEWREALFTLLTSIPASQNSRLGDDMVAAGLFDIFVEVLTLRTTRAERHYPRVLGFLDTFAFNLREGFSAFVNAKGLDAIADLTGHEVDTSFESAGKGSGMPAEYKTQHTEYSISFYQQQTLRWLFKFIGHMMTHGGGGIDRLLRNLMDCPQLLGGLRKVLANASIYGSTVWSSAVNILASFIHHEPTSYAIIAEAGLSKTFLEAVTQTTIPDPNTTLSSGDTTAPAAARPAVHGDVVQDDLPKKQLAGGILPVAEAISSVPPAFGAICLTEAGMNLFRASTALESFFEVFLSPAHVKAMDADGDTASTLGTHFDELVRHHPTLKPAILTSVKNMVARVGNLCFLRAQQQGVGAKLWTEEDGRLFVAGGRTALKGEEGQFREARGSNTAASDIDMADADAPIGAESEKVAIDDIVEHEDHKDGPMTLQFINAVCKFLSNLFVNDAVCSAFIEEGGLEFVLDFTTLPCLPYNFNQYLLRQDLSQVIQQLVEQRPHLTLPSLVNRLQTAVDTLEPMMNHENRGAFFSVFTDISRDSNAAASPWERDALENGTKYAKALLTITALSNALHASIQGGFYSPRHSHYNLFNHANLADMYAHVVDSLSKLHRSCIWEEILLQGALPADWEKATAVKSASFGTEEADNILRIRRPSRPEPDSSETSNDRPSSQGAGGENMTPAPTDTALDRTSAQFRNTKTLRYLLSQVQISTTPFLQALGKCLLHRRTQDPYQRQNAYIVAEQIAKFAVEQLTFKVPRDSESSKNRYAYWILTLTTVSQLMVDSFSARGNVPQLLTLVMSSFQKQKGMSHLSDLLERFFDEAKGIIATYDNQDLPDDVQHLMNYALGGIKIVLNFYSKLVNSKNVTEAAQTIAMNTRDRNRPKPESWLPGQFLVELRYGVIRPVEKIWNSDLMDKADTSIVKTLIDILRTVLEGEGENEAFTRAQQKPQRARFTHKPWKLRHPEHFERLKEAELEPKIEDDLASEALFRCYDQLQPAREYCQTYRSNPRFARNPIPAYELEGATPGVPQGSGDDQQLLEESEEPGSQSVVMHDVTATESTKTFRPYALTTDSMSETSELDSVVVEDLEVERSKIRSNLIDRSLEVLNVHDDVTFELSDLVSAAVAKDYQSGMRSEVGETLLNAIVSLQSEEDFRPVGKKIASYAHLLALTIQDGSFYEATLPQLKDFFGSLLGFIKVYPDQRAEDSSPWIGHILLIIERLLADDAKPHQIEWTPPKDDETEADTSSILEMPEPVVSTEDKGNLFDAIIDVLPRVGKDETLALSVARVLVILTRSRQFAAKIGERRNLQRLFVMVKQLSGVTNEKLQSAFMLILRHIVEDEETIRQIMRTEIIAMFEGRDNRARNNIDTSAYARQLWYVALRAPEIFVEITNEKLTLKNYDGTQRQQTLLLKKAEKKAEESEEPSGESVKPSTEDDANGDQEKSKPTEMKAPVVENPDGVIHYLLCELLTYKDVEDKEQASTSQEQPKESTPADVEMTNAQDTPSPTPGPVSAGSPDTTNADQKKNGKPIFKADQNPIFIYRCFILQCLTELLLCYNRTKVEFINFSRKADPHAITPSKPRSGVLNYILNALIPIGTLVHAEDLAFRKRCATSNWAISVVVALCQKTGERGFVKSLDLKDEDGPELLFVRKFVLEHALKAFKDANASTESPDVKYSRLLNLSDLFHRMLAGKATTGANNSSGDMLVASQKQLARIMYEKNFISALTTSIADIDLNFPNAKRAVKYILRPIKLLTHTAIELSVNSDISSTPGATDEDEISTATSVSDVDEFREETPDLFRNSTLAMFDPGRDEESESEESGEEDEDDMYGDEYGDEMEYEEEYEHDEGDVVSDEDEEIEGMGTIEGLPGDAGDDVEIVIEGEDDGMSGDDEDADSADMDEDDDGGEDDDDDIEIMDEVTGDDENGSMDEGDEEEWASEEDDEEAYGHEDAMEDEHDAGDINNLVRILDGQPPPGLLEHLHDNDLMMDMGRDEFIDDEIEEDDEEEGDEEEDYDEDIAYEAGMEEDDEEGIWDWSISNPIDHYRYHAHGHRGVNPWSFVPTTELGQYRSHRPSGTQRGTDDGTNPLLQRSGRASGPADPGRRRGQATEWVHTMDGMRNGRMLPNGDSPVTFISNLLNIMSHGSATLNRDRIHVTVEGMFRDEPGPPYTGIGHHGRRSNEQSSRSSRDDPAQAVSFTPTLTIVRWQEEAKLLYPQSYLERASRTLNAILRLLVPPAIKFQKEEQRRKEESRKKEIEEKEKRDRERAEQEEKERIERQEREAAEKAETEAAAATVAENASQGEDSAASAPGPAEGQSMEGVETSETIAAEGNAEEAAEPAERVITNFRGNNIDITDLGIDLEYFEALPEDMREEVLMGQIQHQREEARTHGDEPTEISAEFLEALPSDIREELLAQEAAARRRQERQDQRRAAAASGEAGPRAEDMDTASFLATLDQPLRQAILMDQDDAMIETLPDHFRQEARRLGGDRRLNHVPDNLPYMSRLGQVHGAESTDEQAQRKSKPRPIVQMLDKAGVATLLRLMFITQNNSANQTLNGILKDVCQNRHNRAEVISILLSILQDGSADLVAVERSFAQLSLRAKQPAPQKTPQPLKRSLTGQVPGHADMSPQMVVQQCLSTLVYLVYNNPHICSFFLAEHETAVGFKSKATRKGKAKESKSNKYPLNALLGLLDRQLIVESAPVMEQLASLLTNITDPLNVLLKKDKGKTEEKKDEQTQEEGSSTTPAQITAGPTETTDTAMEPSGNATTEPSGDNASEGANGASAPMDEAKAEEPKKGRGLVPPEVPDYNLRLVIQILAARECRSKTFKDTLSVINNLSAIPGAKEIFGQELIRQAQDLGQSILKDLDDLVAQITQAKTGTDVQGMALSKFSPASSDQTKLLRVLTALDYLFDPKRSEAQNKPSSDDEGLPAEQKADILTTLYENATFGPLWNKLSECLTTIRLRTNMLSVATILLPLIEVLMVVCKNTTLKDAPPSKVYQKEFAMTSPPPESRMENLFFNFTEEHRKILNDLVRNNPKLMSGSFSVLVKNSKVLEFDNKRNYFNRRLHSRGSEMRQPHPTLQLQVRRDQVFLDSFKSLYFKNGDEMKYGKLSIKFHGEEGVDAGGVTREWFQVLSRQMFNPDYALFIPVASDRTTFHPNRMSSINPEHLFFFKFIGRIIGKALYEGRVLDCHFSRAVYKRILGKPVSIKDMETLDLDYYKSLLWMLENDITDIITETFAVETEAFGVIETIDLIENGRNIPVTEENKQEYVRLMVEYKLTGSVKEQLDAFLEGFHDIVPAELISIFNEQELELLISGLPEIDVDDWKNNTEYHNYTGASPQIQWFWRAVRAFDKEERAKLLQFVTGTSKVPLNGFKELEGMNGFSRFNIHRDYGSKDRLPSSHTCFNQLDLPEYDSYEALRAQLYMAVTAGSSYFGFA